MIKDEREIARNEILHFIKELNNKNLQLVRKSENNENLEYHHLFSKNFLFIKCFIDVISGIEFCHKIYLTFEEEFNFKNIFYNVGKYFFFNFSFFNLVLSLLEKSRFIFIKL